MIVGRDGQVQGWGAQDTVLISRKPFSAGGYRPRARAARRRPHAGRSTCRAAAAHNQFYDLLRSPDPAEYERNYTFDITPVTRQPPVLLLHRAAARPVDLLHACRSQDSADYKINKAVPLLFALMAVSLVATLLISAGAAAGAGHAPAAAAGRAAVPAVLPVHRRGLHSDRSGADSEVRAVPGPSGARALTVVIFSMLVSSGLGSFASRRLVGQERGAADQGAGRGGAAGASHAGDSGLHAAGGRWCGCRSRLKIAMTVALIAPLGLRHGDAVSRPRSRGWKNGTRLRCAGRGR